MNVEWDSEGDSIGTTYTTCVNDVYLMVTTRGDAEASWGNEPVGWGAARDAPKRDGEACGYNLTDTYMNTGGVADSVDEAKAAALAAVPRIQAAWDALTK